MKGFKAFKKGLICNNKQYAENTVFEEENAKLCCCGIHFCESPFDTLDYYPLIDGNGDFTEFTTVESLEDPLFDGNNKYCTKKIKIGTKLNFPSFIKAGIESILEKTQDECIKGEYARIVSGSNYAQIGSSGHYAQIGSSGSRAQIGSSGDNAQIESSSDDAVICCAGHGSIVKAKKGSWITLSEWKYSDDKKRYIPFCVKTEYVDGEVIKEDTFYKLENGKFVQQSEN